MKIGILTQPLQNNYGGLLQNYALQQVLRRLGQEACTINLRYKKKHSLKLLFWRLVRLLLSEIAGRKIRIYSTPTHKEAAVLFKHTRAFVENNISTTEPIFAKLKPESLCDYGFGAYIVGSDQVWRPRYSPQLPSFFLDFLANNTAVKKIAYAASFGVNAWEFSEAQTSEFGRLLRGFDAVSVREDSGVDMCRRHFGLQASLMPDPVLLLEPADYSLLTARAQLPQSEGELFTYILDKTAEKDRIVHYIAQKQGLKAFSTGPGKNKAGAGRNLQDYILPPVEAWLKSFMDARFVITDSFHGTVFSILFNKPFITLANHSRGLSRLSSLLEVFELSDRLLHTAGKSPLSALDQLNDIDWAKTNRILQDERAKALQFLTTALAHQPAAP